MSAVRPAWTCWTPLPWTLSFSRDGWTRSGAQTDPTDARTRCRYRDRLRRGRRDRRRRARARGVDRPRARWAATTHRGPAGGDRALGRLGRRLVAVGPGRRGRRGGLLP